MLAPLMHHDHRYQAPVIWLVQIMAAAGIPDASKLLGLYYLAQAVLLPREVLRTSHFVPPVWRM